MIRFCISTLTLLSLPWVSGAQITFTEIADVAGFTNTERCESIAIGDYNNDGYEDIYLGFFVKPNQLWRNEGDGTFTEVTAEAGVSVNDPANTKTAIWGDIDNDGWLDLYVGNRQQPDKLYHNNGDGTFVDISSSAGILQLGYPLSVNMADVNNDGYLDIYISNFNLQNILFLNDGDLTFTNYTFQSGALDMGQAMGAIFFDYDRDGDSDLYLVHDGRQPNFLYQNDGTGRFTEVGATARVNTESFGMGIDVGDIDNDGWLDIYIANLYHNFLLHHNGDGTFTEIADSIEVNDVGMGWGTSYLDYDNDGLLDIYVANEYQFSPHPNVFYRNEGNLNFTTITEGDPACNTSASYGTATFDYNLDGKLDIGVANRPVGQRFELFENGAHPGNWIMFKLIGIESNRQAVGAKVELQDDLGNRYYDELTAGNSWVSQNSQLFHFGLGEATAIDSLIVHWPSGLTQSLAPVATENIYTIIEGREPAEGILFEIPEITNVDASPAPDRFDWRVFPNPTEGILQIQTKLFTATVQHLALYNSVGQLLWQDKLEGASGALISRQLDTRQLDLAPGLYTMKLNQATHAEIRRIVVR